MRLKIFNWAESNAFNKKILLNKNNKGLKLPIIDHIQQEHHQKVRILARFWNRWESWTKLTEIDEKLRLTGFFSNLSQSQETVDSTKKEQIKNLCKSFCTNVKLESLLDLCFKNSAPGPPISYPSRFLLPLVTVFSDLCSKSTSLWQRFS